MSIMAMILAGGEGPALSVLTALRSEAAVPFAGKYRVIDFALSNCVNSGIFDVAVLTQYQPRSLNEHIGVGRPWDLDRTTGGVRLLQPYQRTKGERGAWQEGTADAIRFNLDVLRPHHDELLVLAGDHIYKMDYKPLLRVHRDRGADATIALYSVPRVEAHRFGMVSMDSDGRVVDFEEKPKRPRSSLASMGVYVFKRQVLQDWLLQAGKDVHDLGRDVIGPMVKELRVYGYHFHGYWADAGTIQAYYEANMSLLTETPALNLHDQDWVIHTRSEERPGALIGAEARVEGNLLCDGCRIDGTVLRSIISPGVYVASGAEVRDSIIMTDAVIESGAIVDRAILDKRVHVQSGAHLGWGDSMVANRNFPDRLNTGLTIAGKGAVIPAGAKVGRNVLIYPRIGEKDFPMGGEVQGGETIGA
jgi:glucose-1-phosphate adenylyltransferase